MAFVLAFRRKMFADERFFGGVVRWRVQNWREARQKRFIVGEKLDYDCETQNFSHQHRLLKGESNLIAIKLWKMVFQLFFFSARLLSQNERWDSDLFASSWILIKTNSTIKVHCLSFRWGAFSEISIARQFPWERRPSVDIVSRKVNRTERASIQEMTLKEVKSQSYNFFLSKPLSWLTPQMQPFIASA